MWKWVRSPQEMPHLKYSSDFPFWPYSGKSFIYSCGGTRRSRRVPLGWLLPPGAVVFIHDVDVSTFSTRYFTLSSVPSSDAYRWVVILALRSIGKPAAWLRAAPQRLERQWLKWKRSKKALRVKIRTAYSRATIEMVILFMIFRIITQVQAKSRHTII